MLEYFITYPTFTVMKVIITAATDREILQIKEQIVSSTPRETVDLGIFFHTSGVGMLASCFSISKLIFEESPDLIIQVGIAGSFDLQLVNGLVVSLKSDCLGDLGVEENGLFKDTFDMNLAKKNEYPFKDKKLQNHWCEKYNFLQLKEVDGITINEVTTKPDRIEQLKEKFNCQIESMEGAALHYCCLQTNTPFMQIRSISNRVGERDKRKWEMAMAINNLTSTIIAYVEILKTLY